eukprot:m.344217 g.344217  ORF g.344217 m.344217 type:complete len:493 (-) comp24017_c0_seq1:54-1532(-)
MMFTVIFLGVVTATSACCRYTVDIRGANTSFPQPWEESVGSGHASLSLRADWRAHLTRCATELGVKRVRFHGLLDDDFSLSLGPNRSSYVNLDSLIDFTTSIGVVPLFELSFMPSWLAMNKTLTTMHYKGITSYPKNYSQWGEIMESMATHLIQRYGEDTTASWLFEVWNEPNGGFWENSNQSAYFKLYKETADAFMRVSPKFKIGGPATAGCPGWIEDLKAFTNSTNTTMSFASCHVYGGGSNPDDVGNVHDVIESLPEAKRLAGNIPLVITEWSSSWMYTVPFHDEPGSAPFIIATASQTSGLADIMSYWTFSDVFEEGGLLPGPFHGGFGLLTVHGTPKPAYRAFQLLHEAGYFRLPSTDLIKSPPQPPTTEQNILVLSNGTVVSVFLYNHEISGDPGTNVTTSIDFGGSVTSSQLSSALITRIDAENANPKAKYEEMGSPAYPTQTQLHTLEEASQLVWTKLPNSSVNGTEININIPAHGLAVIRIKI